MSPFVCAIIFTAITLFLLGALESYVTRQESFWYSGLTTLFTGEVAAAIAYMIGKVANEHWLEPPEEKEEKKKKKKKQK